jgi:hypothetical protein
LSKCQGSSRQGTIPLTGFRHINYNKYNIVKSLDLQIFVVERNKSSIKCEKSEGLCEIEFITIIYLSKVHLLNLRKFSYDALNQLKSQLL